METQEKKPVSIHYREDGKPDGILIQTLDMSFILALHDAEDGKRINWNKATKKYNIPTIQQWLLVMVYKEEVNKCLVEAGGEMLRTNNYYWSATEYSAISAWTVNFGGTYSNYNYKGNSYYVRKLL